MNVVATSAILIYWLGMLAPAAAQQPVCSQCVNTAPVYDAANSRSYVLIQSGRLDGDCSASNAPGWTFVESRAQQAFGPTAHLVSIHDPVEQAFIAANVMTKPEIQLFAWIGLRASSNCGSFSWSDMTPTDFFAFCEPNTPCNDVGCPGGGFPPPVFGVMQKNANCWKLTVNARQCCSSTPIHGIVRIPCPDRLVEQPASACLRPGVSATLTARLSAPDPTYQRRANFQWYRDGVALGDGPTGTGSTILGSRCAGPVDLCRLFIVNPGPADNAVYYVEVSTICRPPFQSSAAYVSFDRTCAPDINCDQAANSQDFFDFLAAFFSNRPEADNNGNGTVDSQDFFDFVVGLLAGC